MNTKTKTKTTQANQEEERIAIAPPNLRRLRFSITSLSPYISHKWSEKAKAQLRMSAAERKKQPKVARNPLEEAEGGAYRVEGGPHDGEFGIPAMAVKAAMMLAAHKDHGLPRTDAQKAIRFRNAGVIPIRCAEPKLREDIVRVGNNQTDIRYRYEFSEWSADIELVFNSDILNASDIINLANRGGFGCGIGEWRPQKGGEHGCFEVDTTQPVQEEAI